MRDFNPIVDMNAIDGCIADLAARTDRPQGYPFSRIIIYSVCPQIADFMPKYTHLPASDVPSMRKLDFKKVGKTFGNKVQQMKDNLSQVPEEYIITATRFDVIDDSCRKTTGCRKYLVEVESDDNEELWETIKFRKAIKKYITEDMGIHILPSVFGDKYPELNKAPVARVWVDLLDCKESLYQALEKYGHQEFSDMPIRLRIPTRTQIAQGLNMEGAIEINDFKFRVSI